MEFCECGRQATAKCISCKGLFCGLHAEPHGETVICRSCAATAETARLNAVDREILGLSGNGQIVAALSTEGGLTQPQFDRLRSLGVGFKTSSPWDEVKRLYQDRPISTGRGTQYHLAIRTRTPIIGGCKDKSHDLPVIPAINITALSSEGYVSRQGLLTADGIVLERVHSQSGANVHFADTPTVGKVSGSAGLSPLQARKIVDSYRREVELRVRKDPSVRLNDSEASSLIEPMFAAWKRNAKDAARWS